MATDLVDPSVMLERLSALADGELDAAESVAQACAHWREDEPARAAWHSYQLIGDVLRSEDLASEAAHDSRFMNAFRARLAKEPVILAPIPLQTQAQEPMTPLAATNLGVHAGNDKHSRRWSWRASGAVAAGFMAVVGVLMVTRAPGPPTGLASGGDIKPTPVALAVMSTAAVSPPTDPQVLVANGKLMRDVRLDRYLAAHKQFAGSSALGVPSALLRNATADASDR